METRRIYTDEGVLLREGRIPSTVPNTREASLQWWAESDAADAAARVQALLEEEGSLGPDPADLLEQIKAQELVQQRLVSPDQATLLAQQLASAQLAPAAIAGELQLATETIRGTAAEARGDLEALRELVAQSTDRLAQLEAATAEAISSTAGRLEVQHAEAMARGLATLAVRAAELRGPEGPAGPAGPGIGIVSGAPNGQEATVPAIGRPAVPGDLLIDGSDDMRPAYRFDGQAWERGPSMATIQVRDVKISSLDASQKIYPTVSGSATGGGGGSGLADPLTVSIISKGASVAVADSSRWQAGGYDTFTSGIIHLEFIPNQGIMGGRHHFVTAAFVLLAGVPDTFQVTEFSVLGGGFNGTPPVFDVSFNGSLGAASAPGVLGIALPPGTQPAARLFVTIAAADPATRDFTIKGNVIWTPEAATGVQMPTQPVRKQPAWLLVS
jgi:hypothetical protein